MLKKGPPPPLPARVRLDEKSRYSGRPLPHLPPQAPNYQTVDSDSDDEYEDVQAVNSPRTPTSPFPDPHKIYENMKTILSKKEAELVEKDKEAKQWRKKYEEVVREKKELEKRNKSQTEYLRYYDKINKPSSGETANYNTYETPDIQTLPSGRSFEQMSTSDVGQFLKEINLGQYVDGFVQNDIHGKLLVNLDEEIMTSDLEMKKLHARKLTTEVNRRK